MLPLKRRFFSFGVLTAAIHGKTEGMNDHVGDSESNSDLSETLSATRLNPNFSMTWNHQSPSQALLLVGQWLEMREAGEAFSYYEAALVLDPTNSLAACYMGRVGIRMGKTHEVIEKIEKAYPTLVPHSGVTYFLSEAYGELNEFEKSSEYADATLRLAPTHTGAIIQKLRFYAKTEKWSELLTFMGANQNTQAADAIESKLWCILAQAYVGNMESAQAAYSLLKTKAQNKFPEIAKQIENALGS